MKVCQCRGYKTNSNLIDRCPFCGSYLTDETQETPIGNIRKVFKIDGGETDWVATTNIEANENDILTWYNKEFGSDAELEDISEEVEFDGVWYESSVDEIGLKILNDSKCLPSDIQALLKAYEAIDSSQKCIELRIESKHSIVKTKKNTLGIFLFEKVKYISIKDEYEVICSTAY